MTDLDSILDKVILSRKTQEASQFNPAEVIFSLSRILTTREKDVLERRFALNSQKKQTLEQIGKNFNITRERVRQIEREATQRINQAIMKQGSQGGFRAVENTVTQLLEIHGGIMEENDFINQMLALPGDRPENRQALYFIISQLLTHKIEPIKDIAGLNPSWKLKFISLDFLIQTIDRLIELIKQKNEIMKQEKLLAAFQKTEFFQQNQNKLSDEMIISTLYVTQKIKSNIFGDWGLAHWPLITPKRMNDKIYLILAREGKPLYFVKIAELINQAGFDKKIAYPATVHNELILDKKYVLVGRGIYALKEWGYRPGVVSEVIARILAAAKEPLSRDKILEEVLKRRIVRKATIYLALMNKEKFQKLPSGTYELVQPTKSEAETSEESIPALIEN